MANEKKHEVAQMWTEKIKMGLKYRKQFSTEAHWGLWRQQYRGMWDERIKLPLNRVHSIGRSLVPRVYFRNPSVMITPLRPEFEASAYVVEALDNYLIRELNLKYCIKRAIQEAFLTGTGPIKLGYDSEFGFDPEDSIDRDSGTITQVGQKTGHNIEYRSDIKPGMPWALSTKADNVVVPWGYSDPQSLPWIAFAAFRPIEDVKEDSKFNSFKKELNGGYTQLGQELKNPHTPTNRENDQFCLLWEVRDVRTRKVLTICEEKVLLEKEDALQIEGLPWEFIIFNPDSEHFWGTSDVHILSPQQKELNEIRTQASKLRKASVLKWLIRKGVIDQKHLDVLVSTDINDINSYVEVDDDNISSAIHELQAKGLLEDVQKMSVEVEADMRETFGYGRNQMGEMSPYHHKSATEAQIVEAASEIRTDERKDVVADIVTNVLRKWNQMIFNFWDGKRVIDVVGPDGARHWVQYTGEQIKGEYAYRVDPDSGLPISRGLRYQMNKELFELLREDPFIDQMRLRKSLLRQYDWLDSTALLLVKEPQEVPEGLGSPSSPAELDELAGVLAKSRGGNGAPA